MSGRTAGNAAGVAAKPTLPKTNTSLLPLSSLQTLRTRPLLLAILLLSYITLTHLTGIYHFSRGFLLTRVGVTERSKGYDFGLEEIPEVGEGEAPNFRVLEPTFDRAVVVIIDALRSDFIHPIPPNSPEYNPNYHNHLNLPSSSSSSSPFFSLMLQAYPDPPTTTLQRLQAITTGSLPTFIDAGSNFAGGEVVEDSWIEQIRLNLHSGKGGRESSGKGSAGQNERKLGKVGVMGDDTWLRLFPLTGPESASAEKRSVKGKKGAVGATFWEERLTHPFDSFNVEDLHTVDSGIISQALPLLSSARTSRGGSVNLTLPTDPVSNTTLADLAAFTAEDKDWDLLVLHFLGLDHTGHRVGPDHPIMRTKLQQMDDVVNRLIELLQPEGSADGQRTLLVLMGDHGMDKRGDHGGDGRLETSSAMYFYGLGADGEVYNPSQPIAEGGSAELERLGFKWDHLLKDEGLPRTRQVDQIDLVPTISLLMGVPIPFNNLGSIIPELFLTKSDDGHDDFDLDRLVSASQANAEQVERYLCRYPSSSLDPYRAELGDLWETAMARWNELQDAEVRLSDSPGDEAVRAERREAQVKAIEAYRDFIANTLSTLRALWAQFSIPAMGLGLAILFLSIPTILSLYLGIRATRAGWAIYAFEALSIGAKVGVFVGSVVGTSRGIWTRVPGEALGWGWTGFVVGSEIGISAIGLNGFGRLLLNAVSGRVGLMGLAGPGILLLYAGSFGANSFIIWEDRMVSYLLTSLLILPTIKALAAPSHRLRLRIFGFSLLAAGLVRFISVSTVCREEQHPYCHVTFYGSSSTPTAPSVVNAALYLLAWYFPVIINLVLSASKSNTGPAPIVLQAVRYLLVASALYWTLESAESWDGLNPERIPLVRAIRIWVARAIMGMAIGAGAVFWNGTPLCIEVRKEIVPELDPTTGVNGPGHQEQTVVYGFANSFGAAYTLFLCLPFVVLVLVSQPTAQAVLIAGFLLLYSHLEAVDNMRDARAMQFAFANAKEKDVASMDMASLAAGQHQQPRFREIIPLALLGHVLFFTTGHQATFSSIQWKAAFVGLPAVTYPLSPLLVILNTFGGYIFIGLALPLIALWNVSPAPKGRTPVISETVQASLALLLSYIIGTVTSAASAAWLRRHLMVWKVFAPRFMLAASSLVAVEVGLLLGIALGVGGVASKIKRTFGTLSI